MPDRRQDSGRPASIPAPEVRDLFLTLLLAVSTAVSFAPPDRPGLWQVDTTHIEVPSGARRFRSILYKPVRDDTIPGDRPAVVFGHGFLAGIDRYDSICRHLSSHGFYVLVPGYPDPGLFRPPARLANDMLAALVFLDSLNELPGVGLNPRNAALVGHSMGGGAAFLAARRDCGRHVRAVAGLSPYLVSRATHVESLDIPVLVLAGENDRTARAENVRNQFYDPCSAPCFYLCIRNAGHNGYLDHTNAIEDRFEPFNRQSQLRAVRTYLTAFLRYYLEGDDRNRPWLLGAAVRSDITVLAEYK